MRTRQFGLIDRAQKQQLVQTHTVAEFYFEHLEPLVTVKGGRTINSIRCKIAIFDASFQPDARFDDQAGRQFMPDPTERKQVECLSEWIDSAITRVNKKSLASGCQAEHPPAG